MQVAKEAEVRVESIQELELPEKSKRLLGEGAYASVKLVFHKRLKRWFALKQIDLRKNVQRLTKEKKLELVKREIKLHKNLKHKHVIRLYDYFKMGDRVFLLMELASKGNLFKHIKNNKSFDEQEAIRLFKQVVLGIEYLHSKNVIHRDLKPENILITEDGDLKICDFGWSVNQDVDMRQTFCGTYEYMAPEILDNTGYDKKVDIWSLGILFFELLHGYSPFKGKQMMQVFSNIKRSVVKYRSGISNGVKNLINGILRPNPDHRLTIEQIKNHEVMNKFTFQSERVVGSSEKVKTVTDLKRNLNHVYDSLSKQAASNNASYDKIHINKITPKKAMREESKPAIKIDGKVSDDPKYGSFNNLPYAKNQKPAAGSINRTNSSNLNRTRKFIPKLNLVSNHTTESSKGEELSTLRCYLNQIPKNYTKRNRSLGCKMPKNGSKTHEEPQKAAKDNHKSRTQINSSIKKTHQSSFKNTPLPSSSKMPPTGSNHKRTNILNKKVFNSVEQKKGSAQRRGVNMGILNNMLNNLSNRENIDTDRKGATDRFHFRHRSLAADKGTSRREINCRNNVVSTNRDKISSRRRTKNTTFSVGRKEDQKINYMFTQRGVRNTEKYDSGIKNKTMIASKTRAVSYDINSRGRKNMSFIEKNEFPKKSQKLTPKPINVMKDVPSRVLQITGTNSSSFGGRKNVMNNIWNNLHSASQNQGSNVRTSYERNDSYFFKESYNLLKTSKDKLNKKIKNNSFYNPEKESNPQKPIIPQPQKNLNENSMLRPQSSISSFIPNQTYMRRQKESQKENILKKAYFYKRKSKQNSGFIQVPRDQNFNHHCFQRKITVEEDQPMGTLHFY